ncbi:unnamed protein product [Schistosoma turkestanicum]|nr:unnamed protein product [Schistosoma turkestanicum]
MLRRSSSSSASRIVLIMYDFRCKEIAQYIYQQLLLILNNTEIHCTSCSMIDSIKPKFIWSEPYINTTTTTTNNNNTNNSWIRCGRRLIPAQFDLNALKHHTKKSPENAVDDDDDYMMVYIGHIDKNTTTTTHHHDYQRDLQSIYHIQLCLPELNPMKIIFYDSITGELDFNDGSCSTGSTGIQMNALLKRRTYFIEKAKDAQYIGILVCTLSIQHYQHIIDRLKLLLTNAKRSYITLIVGRITPEKLCSLPELELLILIACPETSLIDSHDIPIPVITPFEMECALRACYTDELLPNADERTWTAEKFWLDFHDLLPGGQAYMPVEDVIPQLTESFANVSLINGHSHLISQNNTDLTLNQQCADDDCQSSLVVQSSRELIDTAQWNNFNTSKLHHRTWYGLEPKIGETPLAQIKDGRIGLPTHYTHEENGQLSE